ncbi:MAG: hypothetical protein MUF42_03475 [Cytophagaceae bacterium]|jgi:DNA-binding NtrC family response regulator|nr:hypothetical protein [Cytophagaceae bacterium]
MASILILGRHASILEKVKKSIESWGHQCMGATTDEEVRHLVQHHSFDVLLFGGGVEEESRNSLQAFCQKVQPSCKFLLSHPQHVQADLQRILSS